MAGMTRGSIVVIAAVVGAAGACRYHGVDYAADAPPDRADAPPGSADAAIDAVPGAPDASIDAMVAATTVTFGEAPGTDFAGVTVDSWIDSTNPTMNHGSDGDLAIDASPVFNGLMRFDLTALPPGTAITGADLLISTTADPLDTGTIQIFPALEQWGEAGVTWNNRMGGTAWSDAGASPPGSRSTFAIGEFAADIPLTQYTVPLAVGTVQTWIDTPSANKGMVMISTSVPGNGGIFVGRDDTLAPSSRPVLRVTYLAL
jgi:hypothetical protein